MTARGKSAKTYMQNLASSECTTTYRTVYDNRDEQAYVIQRLADGKCWMMTNLNLGAVTLAKNLTSANTNLSTTITYSTFNSWKKSSATSTYTSPEYIPVSGTDSVSKTPYGTLYNFCAASGDDSRWCKVNVTSQPSPVYDICPAGWKLPVGGPSGDFAALYNNSAYNSISKMRASYTSGGAAFALAGYFMTAPADQGHGGRYWTSTLDGANDMKTLAIDGGVDPDVTYSRNVGRSIRCILK